MARTIVVTGAASGIGASTRELLEKGGDRVIGVDLADTDVTADLSTRAGRRQALDDLEVLSGGVIDGIVTCAGLSGQSPLLPLVNYFGTTEVVTGLRPALAESPTPRVVLIGSISGTHPTDEELVAALLADDEEAAARRTAQVIEEGRASRLYPSSKSAVAQWARRTAVSPGWADAGIAVNVVAPGVVLTPMSAQLMDEPTMRQVMDAAVPMPLHGYAEPEDLARVVGFLLAPSTTHVTGQVLYVDGGAEATVRSPAHF